MTIEEFEKKVKNENGLLISSEELNTEINNMYKKKVVLGIDIYKYSKFPLDAQTLIPYIFYKIIDSVIYDLNRYEPIFFSDYSKKNFEHNFINTGDGGFIVLDTPLHGLLFSIYLSSKLKIYNTGKLSDAIKITGEITYRYAMSFGEIFNFENNWFGPAIITCARILSVDKLNRFLIEENVKDWFDQNTNGIETMLSLGLNNLRKISILEKYFINYDDSDMNSLIIPPKGNDPGLINSNLLKIELSKIDTIEIKNDKISIYNLYLQIYIVFVTFKTVENPDKYIISIGNTNVNGL